MSKKIRGEVIRKVRSAEGIITVIVTVPVVGTVEGSGPTVSAAREAARASQRSAMSIIDHLPECDGKPLEDE